MFYLFLQINKKEEVEAEFNPTFIERLLPKLDWPTVHLAAQMVWFNILLFNFLRKHDFSVSQVDLGDVIPPEQPANIADNEELLQKLHHLLLEIDVLEGQLECPETGRVFPITDGIPNMLLNEDEVQISFAEARLMQFV